MVLSHLTCCPNMYPKCFNSFHPRTYPRPDRFTWPVLIWRVVTNNYLKFSKLFAPEIIPNPTGLHGCFSFDVLSKQVPKVFPKYSPPKVSTPDRSICPFSHLTRCPEKYLTSFKGFAPEIVPDQTGLYGPFSFEALSKKVPEGFQIHSPQKLSYTWSVYMAIFHVTCCPKMYLFLKS